MTGAFIVITLLIFSITWIVYDIWVVWKFGDNAGKTISWSIWSWSKQYPAIPFFTGLVFGLLFGHFFLEMN